MLFDHWLSLKLLPVQGISPLLVDVTVKLPGDFVSCNCKASRTSQLQQKIMEQPTTHVNDVNKTCDNKISLVDVIQAKQTTNILQRTVADQHGPI